MPAQGTEGEKPPKAPHAAAIAGIIFAILLTISMVLIRRAMPAALSDAMSGASRIDISRSLTTGLNLLPFAGLAFLWFIGVIRDYLGNREDRFLATVLLGSGVLFVAMLFVLAGIVGGTIASVTTGTNSVANANIFLFGRATGSVIAFVYAARMAGVFMISTTTLTRRVDLMPRWLAYLGYLFAVVLLIGISRFEWILLLFPVWVLIFSVFLLFKRPRRQTGTATGTA